MSNNVYTVSVREDTTINRGRSNNVYTVSVREDITINTEVGLTSFIQSLYVKIQQLILR